MKPSNFGLGPKRMPPKGMMDEDAMPMNKASAKGKPFEKVSDMGKGKKKC